MKRTLFVSLAALLVIGATLSAMMFSATAEAQDGEHVKEQFVDIKTMDVEYNHAEEACIGYLAWDDNIKGKRPVVLIVHDWMGRAEFDEARAREIASLGYLAFCIDVYGKETRPTNRDEARAAATKWRGGDKEAFRARIKAGMDEALKSDMADASEVAAMGYCFGGGAVMQLARSGADLLGVVPFHGGYSVEPEGDAGNIKGKVLILHGADDNFEGVVGVHKELKAAGVDYEIDLYGHAVHAFTEPSAGNDPSRGVAYDPQADVRSWERMKDFYAEIFGE